MPPKKLTKEEKEALRLAREEEARRLEEGTVNGLQDLLKPPCLYCSPIDAIPRHCIRAFLLRRTASPRIVEVCFVALRQLL